MTTTGRAITGAATLAAACVLAAGGHAMLRAALRKPAIVLSTSSEGPATLPGAAERAIPGETVVAAPEPVPVPEVDQNPVAAADPIATTPAEQPAETPASQQASADEPAGGVLSNMPEASILDDLLDRRIGLGTAMALFGRASTTGEPIWFLDARRQEDFERGHIPGALSMPASRVASGEGVFALIDAGAADTDLLVIYCTGGDCDASENTAALLERGGFTNFAILEPGFSEWQGAGMPVETGSGSTPGATP
ncbi:MAG: rhodanese-like domain-containing protein [Planctomycetota bacterium]